MFALATEGSPAFIPGAFQVAVAQFKAIPKMMQAFRTGLGLGWHEHDASLFHGTERFFRPGYAAYLVSSWIPALDGACRRASPPARTVADRRLQATAASTIIMAEAFPASKFIGFDYHEPSIVHARESARKAGVGERVSFEVASAKSFPGNAFDLVTMFDLACTTWATRRGPRRTCAQSLRPDGTWMIVEPFANDRLEENLNPVGRVFYSASTASSARRHRARRKSAAASARRRARSACARSSAKAGSSASGVPPRRRST